MQMNKFKVEWLEGYGDVKPKICTMDNFVSEEFNLDSYWGDDGMIEKLRELLTSKVGEKVQLSGMGESIIATKLPKVVYWEGDEPPTLKEAQEIVGGLIEIVPYDYHKIKDTDLIVNEEGLIHGLELNVDAKEFCKIPLAGNVLVLKGEQRLK